MQNGRVESFNGNIDYYHSYPGQRDGCSQVCNLFFKHSQSYAAVLGDHALLEIVVHYGGRPIPFPVAVP